jgi:hypothetical protein
MREAEKEEQQFREKMAFIQLMTMTRESDMKS